MKSEIIFQSSPWFILLCLVLGAVYAFLMYQKKYSFSTPQRWLLAAVRTLVVAVISFLLLSPLLKSEEATVIPPTVVLAVDNSASMLLGNAAKATEHRKNIQVLVENLSKKGVQVAIKTLSDGVSNEVTDTENIQFDQQNTNLSQLVGRLKSDYEGQNLTDVILYSDGIATNGISPTNGNYPFRLHTIGVGDTTRKRDVRVVGIFANQIAYLGNKFPVEAEIGAYGFSGKQATIFLKKNGEVIDKQLVTFQKEDEIKRISFSTEAKQVGTVRYSIEVVPLVGEHSLKNNKLDTYIEIVDGKEKILLLAASPHPDIKALKAIFEKNELYDVTLKILSAEDASTLDKLDFDVLILHQVPDKLGASRSILPRLLAKNKPTFFILGGQTDIMLFNGMQQGVGINVQSSKMDQVTARLNPAFKQFGLSPDQTNILLKFPALSVPFGDYRPAVGSDVIFHQQVGSVPTQRPLLVVNTTSARKTAILTGEGIWRWRMEEFDLTQNQVIVDEIISKTLQLISVKDDKRKLRVYATAQEYAIDDKVTFENEVYNAIYEKVFDQAITLEITDEKNQRRKYTYTVTADKTNFNVSNLPAGIYSYKATAQVLGKAESSEGRFIIKDMALEDLTTTADFNLLRTLSKQTQGLFVDKNEINKLFSFLETNKSPDKLRNIEDLKEFINLKWLLWLLLALATLEWGVRKYLGTY